MRVCRVKNQPLAVAGVSSGRKQVYLADDLGMAEQDNARFFADRDPHGLRLCSTSGYGYLYAELGLDLFCDVLEPFDEWSKLFLATDDTVLIRPESLTEEEMPTARQLAQASAENTELMLGNRKFKVTAVRLNAGGLSLYSCFEMTGLDNDGAQTRMAVATTLLSCFLLALVLALILAAYLTKPISLLNNRLHRMPTILQGCLNAIWA